MAMAMFMVWYLSLESSRVESTKKTPGHRSNRSEIRILVSSQAAVVLVPCESAS